MNIRDNRDAGRDDKSSRATGGLADVSPATIQARFRDHFQDASYYSTGRDWNDYAPAYRYGMAAFKRYGGKRFEDVERTLEQNWADAKSSSRLVWVEARGAVLDAWRQASEDDVAERAAAGAARH